MINPRADEALHQARSEGKRVVAYSCTQLPRELLDTDELAPYRMRAPDDISTEMADTYLGHLNCSYTRCLLEAVLDDRMDFVDAFAFASSCDHLRRLCDNMRYLEEARPRHIVDLPHKAHQDAVDFYAEELERLRQALRRDLALRLDDEQIAASIRRTNALRSLVSEIQALRRRPQPPISGVEMQQLMVDLGSMPAQVALDWLGELVAALPDREPLSSYRARLLLAGSHMDSPSFVRVLEETGGLVVADTFCAGPGQFARPVPEVGPPLRALAEHYLARIDCARMLNPVSLRHGRVIDAAREVEADGIVLVKMKFCDNWGVDAPLFVDSMRKAGLRVLKLEREYVRGGEGQLRTRVQAFIEMMGK
jgi:benzoyl-CoA reductase/2-hydroxyglutaryl-CoA dehydratase subunit BcrC/BadD/HgdB